MPIMMVKSPLNSNPVSIAIISETERGQEAGGGQGTLSA